MTAEDNKRTTRRLLEELFEKGNLEAPPGSPQGPEGLKETVSWLRDLWGPMRFEIEDEISEGDKVVARVLMHGRHVGEFLGREPTGKGFATKQIHVWRVEDDKVIEHWSVR